MKDWDFCFCFLIEQKWLMIWILRTMRGILFFFVTWFVSFGLHYSCIVEKLVHARSVRLDVFFFSFPKVVLFTKNGFERQFNNYFKKMTHAPQTILTSKRITISCPIIKINITFRIHRQNHFNLKPLLTYILLESSSINKIDYF